MGPGFRRDAALRSASRISSEGRFRGNRNRCTGRPEWHGIDAIMRRTACARAAAMATLRPANRIPWGGGDNARRFYRARHDGQGHGGQSAEGRPSAHRPRSHPRPSRSWPRAPNGPIRRAPSPKPPRWCSPRSLCRLMSRRWRSAPNGLIEGMKPDTAFFDMSTNSVAMVRKINAAFAEKNLYMLDSPVSGGPGGAASGKMAIWAGGDEQQFNRHKSVLDAMGDQARYIGPIGAGTIAKPVHNCTSAVMNVAFAEVFTMGIKAGVDPLDLWEAVRQGATGRARTFDRLGKFLSGTYDPADFALRLLHKDVSLAVGLGKEVGVPLRFANLALEELTAAVNRGWATRDSRVGMLLQVERAKITQPTIDSAKIAAVLANDN